MADIFSTHDLSSRLLAASAALGRATTAEAAAAHAVELAQELVSTQAVSVWEYDTERETATVLESSVGYDDHSDDGVLDRLPEVVVDRLGDRADHPTDAPEATVDASPPRPLRTEAFVPIGRTHVLYLATTDCDGFGDADVATVERLAEVLETALVRIERQRRTVDCDVARALFEQSDDAAFVSATDGALVALNQAAVESTGRDRAELLSGSVADAYGETAAEPIRSQLARVVEGAGPSTTVVQHAEETERAIELTSRLVEGDESTYVHTTAREVSTPDGEESRKRQDAASKQLDPAALRRLNELVVDANGFEETVERLLSLGCDHFGLDTGILARVDGDVYEIDQVVDSTGTHERGAVYDLEDTMCQVTLAGETTEPLAFADVTDTDHRDHSAAVSVRAYVAAPVVVDDDVYGTVNFSMASPRARPFRPEEEEFVKLIARWIGTGLERRRRFEELERYETILEAVDDPVYALDADGRFTFLNSAAKRDFGYGSEVLGEAPAVGMDEADVERVREQIETLVATDERSKTAEFELETADGEHRLVENRLALIGDGEFRGTAGVLHDVTERRRRQRQLELFQQAIEQAADGVAILDDEEYTYIDETHVDMYGFEDKDQLLGNSWRKLYDDDGEVERFEREVLPVLADEGHWRGVATGSRPDGSTFPTEVSLTVIDDGRLVCTVRDETEQKRRQRQLESFQQAIEQAADGVAILDDEEYTYIDETHVDMYGFEDKDQLLGNSWRKLYDDDEVERLEREAFPVLADEGHWRGKVTGSRPDGSTFPAEISLTIVDDGRLVCTVRDETERRARERELELKEQAMDQPTVGIMITDPTEDGNALSYVNRGFEQTTGYAREEVLGRELLSFWSETADGEATSELREAITAGESASLELQTRRKDGTQYWSRLSVTPITDANEEAKKFICIQQDVTERRERERRRRKTVSILKRMYEVTTDPDLSFEEKADGLLAAGSEYLDLPYAYLTQIETSDDETGTQTVVRAQGAHELLQPGASRPLSESYCRKTVESDELVAITHAGDAGWADDPAYDALELETYISGAVGSDWDDCGTLCFAAQTPRETPFTDTEKSFVGILQRWIDYEIDRKNTRAELREQRERLELTLSGTNTGIIEWDPQTDVVKWDETLVDLTGRDVGSVDELEQLLHPEDRDRVREGMEGLLEDGETRIGEARVVGADGEVVWLETRAVPTYDDDGALNRVLATATDVTDRIERTQWLQEFLGSGPLMFVQTRAVDGHAVVDECNDAFLERLGYGREDVIGERLASFYEESSTETLRAGGYEQALSGEFTTRERTLVTEDGDAIPALLRAAPRVDEEGTPGTSALYIDISVRKERERELSEERERFRLLIESVDEYAFLVVDKEGKIQTWNERAADLFGYDTEAAIGMPVAELHPEADRDSGVAERLLQQASVAGTSTHEGWRVRADGSTFYADVQYASLEANDGEFLGYAKVVRDMTDRRRQRRRTERFVEESDDVVTVVDTEGTITYASGSADRVLGYDAEELVGNNLFDFYHPESREEVIETFFTGVENPVSELQTECRFESAAGEWLHVQTQYRNMLADDAVGGMLVYLRDVTGIKERDRRFESLFNQTFQYTGLLEPDGTVVEINDAGLAFTGVDRDAIVGEPLYDVPMWTHDETVVDRVREAIHRAADGEFVRYEEEVYGGGGLAVVDFSIKPVTDEDGEVTLLVMEGRDVTDQRQQRQHLDVMQRVLRHNMRNDLTKVRGWMNVLCEEPDAEKRAEQLNTISQILDKWEAMTQKMGEIRRVLQFQQSQWEKRDAGTLIRDAVEPIREQYPDALILTDVSAADSIQLPSTLLEAVRELAENATKVREDATVEVELTDPASGWVEIHVRDDGPGIPEMEADVLESGEETPLSHGQGLGLWMVRMIVTQAGGEVTVESTDDGSTVRLRLPAEQFVESTTTESVE